MDSLLEVRVAHPADAEAAQEGGAHRLLVGAVEDHGLRPVEPSLVSAVRRVTDLPLRAVVRLDDDNLPTGADLSRLTGLTSDYVAAGAEGVAFGFLDRDLEIDTEVCGELADRVRVPWTFTRVFDRALDRRRAWLRVRTLPWLDGVLTSGAALGAEHGYVALIETARQDPAITGLAIAAGGPRPEHVPWLVRAGIRRLHVGTSVRPDGSWTKAYTDGGLVRSWRLLLDDSVDRAGGQDTA